MPRKKSLQEAVSKEIKSKFDLSAFKDKKGLKQNVKFKEQEWIPLSKAYLDRDWETASCNDFFLGI